MFLVVDFALLVMIVVHWSCALCGGREKKNKRLLKCPQVAHTILWRFLFSDVGVFSMFRYDDNFFHGLLDCHVSFGRR